MDFFRWTMDVLRGRANIVNELETISKHQDWKLTQVSSNVSRALDEFEKALKEGRMPKNGNGHYRRH